MDDQAVIHTYGNTNLPEGTEERPLVTFALFAYNQEKYIREAVEGAFSQTYSPLEIILSDDCSSDRTFEIMEEMAREYRGPHLVKVRQTDRNLRPYSHVLDVAQIAGGEIMVLAAGDDISKPNRTSAIYEASHGSDACAFQSRFDVMDENGRIFSTSKRSEGLFSPSSEFYRYFHPADGHVYVVHGATSAYRMDLMKIAPSDENGILSEDGVFSIILNMKRGKAVFIEESLVKYRTHSEAISNAPRKIQTISVASCRLTLKREMVYAKNVADRAILALRIQEESREDIRPLNEEYLRDEIIIQQAKYKWKELSLPDRARAIRVSLKRKRLGYLLPSILGPALGPRYLYLRQKFVI